MTLVFQTIYLRIETEKYRTVISYTNLIIWTNEQIELLFVNQVAPIGQRVD